MRCSTTRRAQTLLGRATLNLLFSWHNSRSVGNGKGHVRVMIYHPAVPSSSSSRCKSDTSRIQTIKKTTKSKETLLHPYYQQVMKRWEKKKKTTVSRIDVTLAEHRHMNTRRRPSVRADSAQRLETSNR